VAKERTLNLNLKIKSIKNIEINEEKCVNNFHVKNNYENICINK
jgi:hypothetical protein